MSQEAEARDVEDSARIVTTRVGRDLNDSLDEVAERMGSDDFTWVAQAIAIHREVGGNLAEVLDARRQVKRLWAEGKLSAMVLMALRRRRGLHLDDQPGLRRRSLTGFLMLGVAAVMLIIRQPVAARAP